MIEKEHDMIANTDIRKHNISNSLVKIDPLNWPVFEQYQIMSVGEYLERQDTKLLIKFKKRHPSFFEDIEENLGDTTLIVPGNKLSENSAKLDSCNLNVNFFFKFSHLYNPETLEYANDKAIVEWINFYGLPFKTATKLRVSIFKDESTQSDVDTVIGAYFSYEKALEEAFGTYVMFYENLLNLIEEASTLFQAHKILKLKKPDITKLVTLATTLTNSGEDSNFLCDLQPSEYEKHQQALFTILTASFRTRMLGYLNKISPSFLALPSSEVLKKLPPEQKNNWLAGTQKPLVTFLPSWRVPDLWTLMIILFYEYILSEEELRICDFCKKLFYAYDKRMIYCPPYPLYSSDRSACLNAAKVRDKRLKDKQKATSSATEKS